VPAADTTGSPDFSRPAVGREAEIACVAMCRSLGTSRYRSLAVTVTEEDSRSAAAASASSRRPGGGSYQHCHPLCLPVVSGGSYFFGRDSHS